MKIQNETLTLTIDLVDDILDTLADGSEYVLKTQIGPLHVVLNGNHLCCNFLGSELKARSRFGHWKQNMFIDSDVEIIQHLQSLMN